MFRSAARIVLLVSVLAALAAVASLVAALVLRARPPAREAPGADELQLAGVLGGFHHASTSGAFRQARITAIYGGGTLDLRPATLAPDGATIEIRAIFGGARVIVPPSWRVDLGLTGILGGAQDVRDPVLVDPGASLLRIRGIAAFGGLVVLPDAPDLR